MITKSAPSRNTGKQGGGVREEEGQLQQQAPPAVGATVASINRVGTAKRPLPLTRRSNSAPKTLLPSTPSSVQPRSAPAEEQPNPIAVESVLADLQKLHSPKQSLHFPVASPPVSPTRRVHFAQDLTGGGVGLKEVPYSLGTPLLGPMTSIPPAGHQDRARRITSDEDRRQHNMNNSSNNGNGLNNNGNFTLAASESVVPDLMEVYDALTQSSTPQPGGMHPPTPYGNEHQARQDYYGVHQQVLPPALPPVGNTRQSYRNRSIKSVASSDESYSDTSGKRKAVGEAAKASKRKKSKDEMKKKTSNDARWSKRFTWPDELHRDFVAAVFEVGLKHSSPSAIMEHMKQNPDVTSERVKSHLQKYRLNRQKSRNEFMNSYDRALDGFKKNPHDFDDDGDHSFSCGEVAALLTHSVQTEAARDGSQSSRSITRGAEQASTQLGPSPQDPDGVGTLHLPLLTEEESQSPLGQTFGYLVGMFQTLSLELEMKRRAQEGNHSYAPTPIAGNNGQAQHHTSQHQQYHQSLEETAANAASIIADPSIYEVANVIPHALVTKGSTDAPVVQMYTPVGGMYRVQSHSIMQDQHQQAPPQAAHSHQGRQPTQQPPQTRRDPPEHNYHQAPPPSGHVSKQVSVSTQYSNAADQPSSVPCPLDGSSESPSNATGPGTGRTLQAQKESSIMKQDMKSQKAFQNKMRALKQVELNKYGGHENLTSESSAAQQGEQYTHETSGQQAAFASAGGEEAGQETEQAVHDRHGAHSPLQLDHDFWHSEDVDVNDQLFDFLMDP